MTDEELKTKKRNLWCYPMGTIGRDAMYQLFTYFILTFILFTKSLNEAQLVVVSAIMIAARVFDAANDPLMGYIIERTRTKWGKFKPWLALGVVLTAAVVITIFNSNLTGWAFVIEFGIIYFLYSITFTMNDISFWGMIPSLSSDADTRNQFTSRAVLFAGVGGTLAAMLIPMLTTGSNALGGSAPKAYGIISIIISGLAIAFICITLFGVKEAKIENLEVAKQNRTGFKDLVRTVKQNKQLLWIIIIFLLQQIGNGIIAGGLGSTYVYFVHGYSGGLYSLFSTIGVAATAILMVGYPAISRKLKRKDLMNILMITSASGYAIMLLAGLILKGSTLGFWCLTIGYMCSCFGQYGFYLVMMISIMNTVEYNEYILGQRQEAIITSVRPFVTKLASAFVVGFTTLSYLIFSVTSYTNKISDYEQQASQNLITSAEKETLIANVLQSVEASQQIGLLLFMTIIPLVLMFASYVLYKKKYTLDEDEYERICNELKARKENN